MPKTEMLHVVKQPWITKIPNPFCCTWGELCWWNWSLLWQGFICPEIPEIACSLSGCLFVPSEVLLPENCVEMFLFKSCSQIFKCWWSSSPRLLLPYSAWGAAGGRIKPKSEFPRGWGWDSPVLDLQIPFLLPAGDKHWHCKFPSPFYFFHPDNSRHKYWSKPSVQSIEWLWGRGFLMLLSSTVSNTEMRCCQ